jgi:YVTN family beta-propeller protein
MKQKILHPYNVLIVIAFSVLGLLSTLLILSSKETLSAAPTITITSPTSNQQIPGTNFNVTGTASPNTTVVVSNNGISFAQTKSDSAGNWTVNSSLPAGEVKITAKAIENPEYGYFATTALDFSNSNINQLNLNNYNINSNPGWPVNTPRFIVGLSPSPIGKIFYTANAFNPASIPEKFDASNPTEPVPASGTFPENYQTNLGAFSSDGTKYYSGSVSSNNIVSVVDVNTNSHLLDIAVGGSPMTVWRSPKGLIYAALNTNQIKIINPTNNTVESTVNVPCVDQNNVAVIIFSQDINYPFYYVPCMEDGTIKKIRVSDNVTVDSFTVGGTPLTGALSLDNKRMFISNRSVSSDRDKMRVINTEDGSIIRNIDLTAGVLGFISTPDFQKIIIATPESIASPGTFDVQNIDIIDTTTYAMNSVATDGIPTTVNFSPSEIAEVDVDVTFVLGATTVTTNTVEKLAETGAIAVSVTLLLGLIIACTSYIYIDYLNHKRPLVTEDPHVVYSFSHHIKKVTIPMFKYRLHISLVKTK